MKKYEPAVLEIIYFQKDEMLRTMALSGENGDNEIPEIWEDGNEGGIFG